jgi:hypothetical protein
VYARNFVNIPDDIIDFTPEMRAQALEQLKRYKPGPLFNPPILGNVNGLLGSLNIGNAGGGTNWPGGGYDPENHIVFAPASNAGVGAYSLVTPPEKFSDIRYVRGVAGQPFQEVFGPGDCCAADSPRAAAQAAAAEAPPLPSALTAAPAPGGGGGLTVNGLPIVKPPYGVLSAINLDRGELMWSVAHGDTPDSIRNNPALKGLAGDEDAGCDGRSAGDDLQRPARRHASRLRQDDRQGSGRRLYSRAAEWIADDVQRRRTPVHHRGGERRKLLWGVHRLQTPLKILTRRRRDAETILLKKRNSPRLCVSASKTGSSKREAGS